MRSAYRSDRARQLTRTFIEPDFDGFDRQAVTSPGCFVSLTEYNKDFDIPVAFPPERLKNVFGEYIANDLLPLGSFGSQCPYPVRMR